MGYTKKQLTILLGCGYSQLNLIITQLELIPASEETRRNRNLFSPWQAHFIFMAYTLHKSMGISYTKLGIYKYMFMGWFIADYSKVTGSSILVLSPENVQHYEPSKIPLTTEMGIYFPLSKLKLS